jgi:hypothetical protein
MADGASGMSDDDGVRKGHALRGQRTGSRCVGSHIEKVRTRGDVAVERQLRTRAAAVKNEIAAYQQYRDAQGEDEFAAGTTPNDAFASNVPAVLTLMNGAVPYSTEPSDRRVAVVTLNVSVMRPSLLGVTGLLPSP